MASMAAMIFFYIEFHSIEKMLGIPPGSRLDEFIHWRLLPEKDLTANEFAKVLNIQTKHIEGPAFPPPCNKKASVAVCMLGTRWEMREQYNLAPFYKKNVLAYLGGTANVDMFFNYGSSDPDHENDLGEMWPYADRIVNNVSFTKYRFRCPPKKRPLERSGYGLALRMESCLRRIQEQEERCGHRYQWIMRDRPDVYHNEPLFRGKYLQDLDPTKIYAPCLWKKWGVCDLFAMVPRWHAQAYYNLTATMPTLCIPNRLTTEYTCEPDELPWEGLFPECVLSMQLIKAGIDLVDTVRIAGESYLYNIVRNCTCDDNGVAVMPPKYFGPRAGHCGQNVPGASVHC